MFKDYAVLMSKFSITSGGFTDIFKVEIEFCDNYFIMKMKTYYESFDDFLIPNDLNSEVRFLFSSLNDYDRLEDEMWQTSKFETDDEKDKEQARRNIYYAFLNLFPEFNSESFNKNENEILILPYSRLPVLKEIK